MADERPMPEETDELLEQLAEAVRERSELLARQQELIDRLRRELRDVAS